MAISQLTETSQSTDVQRTTFSVDVLGRYVCNTLDEALSTGVFDVIVLGSGMYGGYLAQQAAQNGKRVLVLEAGPFLVSEHVQNLARIGLHVADPIDPAADPGTARNEVWGLPWRGNVKFPGLAFNVGGKSLFWGGWCPRLTAGDLARWPSAVASDLSALYEELEEEIGVVPSTDFISGSLHDALQNRFEQAAATTPSMEAIPRSVHGVQEAPLAVQGAAPASGLFSFDKYSSAPALIDAIRADAQASGSDDSRRRIMLVPNTRALRLTEQGGRVTGIEVSDRGKRKTVGLGKQSRVALALSAVESTRLALESFPTSLMGRNLMVHLRSDLVFRIRRSALGLAAGPLQTSALLMRGLHGGRRFHLQMTAVTSQTGNPEEALFRMIPDLELLKQTLDELDSDWVTLVLRSVGETSGDPASAVPRAGGSWINLSPYERDEYGMRRAWVNLNTDAADIALWQHMESTSLQLAQAISGGSNNIEYVHDGSSSTPHDVTRPFPPWRRGLGTTYHEAGTLWMGTDPGNSVTDADGRFHHIDNVFVCDQSAFPTVASVNPVLTGLCLARRLAARI